MTIGTVDGESALWMVHPGAVYLHEAQSFFVKDLDLEKHIARRRGERGEQFGDPGRLQEVLAESLPCPRKGSHNGMQNSECRMQNPA